MRERKIHLESSEEQVYLTAVLEQVQDAIIACNAEGVLTLFNRAARELHGLPERPVPAEEWPEYYDLYLPDGRTRMGMDEVPLFRACRGEYVTDVELVVAPKERPSRTLLASARPLIGQKGEKLGAIAVMHDITERKQAQDTLQQESALLQALMDNIPDAIYFKDTQSRFTRVNHHAPFRAGKESADVIGKTDFDFFAEEHARAAFTDEQRIMQTGQPVIDKVEREVYPDGSITWLSTTKVPITDEAGRVTGLVGISRDITERKLAEEERLQLVREQAARAEAETAARLKDEFLATLSHELRTPLTAILGWAYLLQAGQFDEKSFTEALEIIERNARTQTRLIDDLLDISRIITGKLRLDLRQSEAGQIIDAAIETLRPSAQTKEIQIEKSIAVHGIYIDADRERLEQVIWNLMSNAIKFTPRGGRVQISLQRINSQLELKVSDSGPGISPDFLPHVFERFRQADQTTTRRHGGLGLGLAIVRHLVELHGGTVGAESAGVGLGATFIVKLPLSPIYQEEPPMEHVHPATGEETPDHASPKRLDGLKILVVDDEPDTRALLKIGLGRRGADVIIASSTLETLAAIEKERFDLLISDIGMPEEDGYELIRRVRSLPEEKRAGIPAIALTAYARVEDRMEALKAGYQLHLAKPVDLTTLVAAAINLIPHT